MRMRWLLLIGLLLAAGCQPLAILQDGEPPAADIRADSDWLLQLRQVQSLSNDQLQRQLLRFSDDRPRNRNRLFLYALLNQHLQDRLGWIRARDSLRQLQQRYRLSDRDQALVLMLQQYNQGMINAHARDSRLVDALEQQREELVASQAETRQLAEKIHALTNLEKSMSIRRALTSDSTPASAGQ